MLHFRFLPFLPFLPSPRPSPRESDQYLNVGATRWSTSSMVIILCIVPSCGSAALTVIDTLHRIPNAMILGVGRMKNSQENIIAVRMLVQTQLSPYNSLVRPMNDEHNMIHPQHQHVIPQTARCEVVSPVLSQMDETYID